MTNKTSALPSIEHIETLADDLIRALAQHPGDDDAVRSVLTRWHDTIDTRDLSLVCMAAMRTVFSECLIPHPDRVPPDGLTLRTPEATP